MIDLTMFFLIRRARVMDVVDFVVETTETDVMPYLHSKNCAKLLSDALSEYLVDGSIDSVHREEGILILRVIVKLIKVRIWWFQI